jgi:hypothetical protein
MDSEITSSQVAHHAFDTDHNELNHSLNPNDNMGSDRDICYEKYEDSVTQLSELKINTNDKYSEGVFSQVNTGNMATQSITSISPNSSEENDRQSVPFNELNDFSATNWANEVEKFQMENEVSPGDDQQSASFLEANLLYNTTTSINEANKVNYNYQEILSFVSNSWQKMEKELTSGTKGKYYYSKSNKTNSKLNNNVQKH